MVCERGPGVWSRARYNRSVVAERFDAIVVGLGAMGSAACRALAERGLRVLGLEQFDIAHDCGSSHGRSRVFRKAYFEDPRYVPLLHRAHDLWRELEAAAGRPLLNLHGCLNLGPADHACIQGARQSAEAHELDHEVLDAHELRRRWPVFVPNEGDIGIHEPDGGSLVPEECIQLQVDLARRAGAVIRTRAPVRQWSASGKAVHVQTSGGRYEAEVLVITAGAWLSKLAADLGLPLRVERQVQLWFDPQQRDPFTVERMPVFIHFVSDRAFYGIPMRAEEGMKVSRHHGGAFVDPDTIERGVTAADEADVRSYLAAHLPSADGPLTDSEVCMYTNTPDDHFIIDRHPQHKNVLLAGGFSGHGFKFSPLVGRILADLAVDGKTREPIEPFSVKRFEA